MSEDILMLRRPFVRSRST